MNLSLEKQTQTVQKVASTTAESKHGLWLINWISCQINLELGNLMTWHLRLFQNVYDWGFVPLFPAEVRHEEKLGSIKKNVFIYSLKNIQHIEPALEVYIGFTQ